jgi:hypothetical protein
MFQIDPQVISDLIDVPVLPISANSFSKDMEPPTLDQLREYFHAHPQFNKRAHALQKLCYTIYGPQLVGVSLF